MILFLKFTLIVEQFLNISVQTCLLKCTLLTVYNVIKIAESFESVPVNRSIFLVAKLTQRHDFNKEVHTFCRKVSNEKDGGLRVNDDAWTRVDVVSWFYQEICNQREITICRAAIFNWLALASNNLVIFLQYIWSCINTLKHNYYRIK